MLGKKREQNDFIPVKDSLQETKMCQDAIQ